MERDYQSSNEYDLNKEIEYNFDKVFSMLRDLGIDVPDYVSYSYSTKKNDTD